VADDDEGGDLRLSPEEIRTLKLMAKYWGGINTVAGIASSLGTIGKGLMYVYAIYLAIRLGIFDKFILGGGGGDGK
jgi:hypothetical protein